MLWNVAQRRRAITEAMGELIDRTSDRWRNTCRFLQKRQAGRIRRVPTAKGGFFRWEEEAEVAEVTFSLR